MHAIVESRCIVLFNLKIWIGLSIEYPIIWIETQTLIPNYEWISLLLAFEAITYLKGKNYFFQFLLKIAKFVPKFGHFSKWYYFKSKIHYQPSTRVTWYSSQT